MFDMLLTYAAMLLGAVGMILLIRWITVWRLLTVILFVSGLLFSSASGVVLAWPLLDYLFGSGLGPSLFPPQVPTSYLLTVAGIGAALWIIGFSWAVSRLSASP